MEKKDWQLFLQNAGSLWRHNGDQSKPHALLTSGKHSDGYNNGAQLVMQPVLVAEVARGMIEMLTPKFGKNLPDFVVGPAFGAITIAHEVAKQMNVKFAFTEPKETPEGKMQVLSRFDIPKGATALVVEDAITTGGSAQKTIDALTNAGINVLPFVSVIIDWSRNSAYKDKEIISLVSAKMNVWEREDCPLCKEGSEAIKPKASWKLFTTL